MQSFKSFSSRQARFPFLSRARVLPAAGARSARDFRGKGFFFIRIRAQKAAPAKSRGRGKGRGSLFDQWTGGVRQERAAETSLPGLKTRWG